MKTLTYRLLRLGALPKRCRSAIEAEGIRILDEGIPVTVTLRNYRAPGKRIRWRRQRHSGAIVLTDKRLAAFVWWGKLFDFRIREPQTPRPSASIDDVGRLCVAFDASSFGVRRAGSIRCCFRTEHAIDLRAALDSSAARGRIPTDHGTATATELRD